MKLSCSKNVENVKNVLDIRVIQSPVVERRRNGSKGQKDGLSKRM